MWKHFTDEQIIAMNMTLMKNVPPERLAQWMGWMLPALNVNELTGMFVGLKKGAPPPVFENMARLAEKALGDNRWAAVKAKAGL